MKNRKIKVAIAGVGNCAQALIEGLEFYRKKPNNTRGLMNSKIGIPVQVYALGVKPKYPQPTGEIRR